ncbi:hypothetical protein JW960_13645 [candidate division KSB1 bacterium]|nr:hypothetical protein [candidate division KSB1 bacterium]
MRDLYISSRRWQGIMAFGIFMILAGLVIIFEPMILIAMIASIFIGIGLFVTWFAWRARRMENSKQHVYVRWDW